MVNLRKIVQEKKEKVKSYADFDIADWGLVICALFFSIVPEYYLITFTCIATLIIRQMVKRDLPAPKSGKTEVSKIKEKKEEAL